MLVCNLQSHIGLARTGHAAHQYQLPPLLAVCLVDLCYNCLQRSTGHFIDTLDAGKRLVAEVCPDRLYERRWRLMIVLVEESFQGDRRLARCIEADNLVVQIVHIGQRQPLFTSFTSQHAVVHHQGMDGHAFFAAQCMVGVDTARIIGHLLQIGLTGVAITLQFNYQHSTGDEQDHIRTLL